jgi:hypothetical protein
VPACFLKDTERAVQRDQGKDTGKDTARAGERHQGDQGLISEEGNPDIEEKKETDH